MIPEGLHINQILLARSKREHCDFMSQRGKLVNQVIWTGSNEIWNIGNNIGYSHAKVLGKRLMIVI